MKNIWNFFKGTLILTARGSTAYYFWVGGLLVLMVIGGITYVIQLNDGLIVTNMRDQVSWGFYISNFTFLVGVAAAAVLLVIPAYVYHWKPIKEIAVLGEMLAAARRTGPALTHAETISKSGIGTTNLPPARRKSCCCRMISSRKFQGSIMT